MIVRTTSHVRERSRRARPSIAVNVSRIHGYRRRNRQAAPRRSGPRRREDSSACVIAIGTLLASRTAARPFNARAGRMRRNGTIADERRVDPGPRALGLALPMAA